MHMRYIFEYIDSILTLEGKEGDPTSQENFIEHIKAAGPEYWPMITNHLIAAFMDYGIEAAKRDVTKYGNLAWKALGRTRPDKLEAVHLALSQIDLQDPDRAQADLDNALERITEIKDNLETNLDDLANALNEMYPLANSIKVEGSVDTAIRWPKT